VYSSNVEAHHDFTGPTRFRPTNLLLLIWLLQVCFPVSVPAAGRYPEGASASEREGLDQLSREIEGVILYTRPPNRDQGEKNWMIDTMRIGEWKAETLDEGVCARWSPDGKHMAVFRTDNGVPEDDVSGSIWLVNADGSGEKYLCDGAGSYGVRGACPLDFHPNNKEIVFIGQKGNVLAVNVATARVRDLELPGRYTGELQLSGNGRQLVGRWRGKGDWAMNRRMVNVDLSSRIFRIYGAGCRPAISPDGKWMTYNHDGHYMMSICNHDLEHRVKFKSRGVIFPQHGWHNWHWSNHNDYIALKSEVYSIRKYNGPPDGFILRFSELRATRFTFGQEVEFPDLFVSRDKKTGRRVPANGGVSIVPKAVGAKKYDVGRVFRTKGETEPDPGLPLYMPRLVVEARLEAKTPVDPRQALKHRYCLVEYLYNVTRIIKGKLEQESMIVSHWVVFNGRRLSYTSKLKEGRTYRLILEPWHLHPELKAKARKQVRIMNDDLLFRFFDVGLDEQLTGKKK
jgi:hypothetical protein